MNKISTNLEGKFYIFDMKNVHRTSYCSGIRIDIAASPNTPPLFTRFHSQFSTFSACTETCKNAKRSYSAPMFTESSTKTYKIYSSNSKSSLSTSTTSARCCFHHNQQSAVIVWVHSKTRSYQLRVVAHTNSHLVRVLAAIQPW